MGNEIFESISDKNHNSDLPILAITQEHGAIPRDFIDYKITVTDKSIASYKVVQIGDFIISLRSFQGGIEYSEYKGICSPAYIILRPITTINSIFYKYYLKTDKYITSLNKKLEGIRDGKMISYKYFSEIPLPCPSFHEQQKIADFLSHIDERIHTQNKIIEELKLLKRSSCKKIFSQELRFKDDSGNEFPAWKEKKLGEIGETYSGLSGKLKENFGSGKPYIQYKQIFDDSKIDISRFQLVEIGINENQNKALFGDVFFTVSSETPNEIGMSSVLLDEIEELYLNSFCFGFRANSLMELSPYFSKYLFRSEIFRTEIMKLAQGSTRYNMSKVQLLKIEIKLPCLEEQNKIANFLSAIDEKIENEIRLLAQYESQKKYLLQNLFV